MDALTVARMVAATRIGVGLVALLAPRLVARGMLQPGRDARAAVVVMRAFAGRDLVLGLGALLAARRRPDAVRGWVEAAGLADAVDALAIVLDRGRTLRPIVALGVGLGAAGTAASALPTASRLTSAD